MNIDKVAGGLRYAILNTIFHGSMFVPMKNEAMENMSILRNTCIDPFMARCIDRCMQAPSKSQEHGAAVDRRRRLQLKWFEMMNEQE